MVDGRNSYRDVDRKKPTQERARPPRKSQTGKAATFNNMAGVPSSPFKPFDGDVMPRVVAVIPARGGSVSVPRKNIKELQGRPLIDWVIQAAEYSGIFAEVWVSTDDDEIHMIAKKCGAKVHRRAASTATNTASTESALVDFVKAHPEYDILCLIQATSPLITPADFIKGFETMKRAKADSLVTAVRAHRFMWKVDPKTECAKATNYDPLKRPRRQDWDGELIENGAFYFTTKAVMDREQCRLGGRIALHEMEEHTFTELDSPTDWQIVAKMSMIHGFWPPGSKKPTTIDGESGGATSPAALAAAAAAGAALCAAAFTLLKLGK
jgi:N-acylneuraminate/3-deoxy-D-glycero-D-galacto-nononate cytidylyltransferase